MRLFEKRSTKDAFWKSVDFVQCCIQGHGCGKPIKLTFYAPINPMKADEKIDYSLFKQMPDFLDLLMDGKPQDYCRKQCLKMCFYL